MLTLWAASAGLLAQDTTLLLLGQPAPAAQVAPIPETVVLNDLSDDGQWLLLTASGDRFVTNDHNGSPDVLLYDRITGGWAWRLVSTGSGGWAGNHTSVGGALSADGRVAVLASRASDLVAGDTNRNWDVFAWDRETGGITLVSVSTNGTSGAGASMNPDITPDGRYVLFESSAADLAPIPEGVVRALYRRDLVTGETEWASQGADLLGTNGLRSAGGRMSPDGRRVAFVAGIATNGLFLRDLEQGITTHLSVQLPDGVPAGTTVDYAAPTLSDDGAKASCLVLSAVGWGVAYYDAAGATAALVQPLSPGPPPGFSLHSLAPELSADGRHVAFVQTVATATETNLQVFLWDSAAGGESVLVSAAPGTSEPANAHAGSPRLSPDGRYVAYLSAATNLVVGADTAVMRGCVWDGLTGETRVLATGQDAAAELTLAMSRSGEQVGAAAPGSEGTAQVAVAALAGAEPVVSDLLPGAVGSISSRGWVAVDPTAVSYDGRYVGALILMANDRVSPAPAQIYRWDTQTGQRDLVSRGYDGGVTGGHAVPQLSRDGQQIAWISMATNLVPDDVNGRYDVFFFDVAAGQTQRIELPPTVEVDPTGYFRLSPNGRYVSGSGYRESWLADLESGQVVTLPVRSVRGSAWSADSHWIALASSRSPYVGINVVNVSEWIETGLTNSIRALVPGSSRDLALSGDGLRLAFTAGTSPTAIQVRVLDWSSNTTVFSAGTSGLSGISLSEAGDRLAWTAADPGNFKAQIWQADLATGQSALASAAPDGVTPGNDNSRHPTLSPDGRYLVYASLASNLDPALESRSKQVYLCDLQKGTRLMISRGHEGEPGTGVSTRPFFSGESQSFFFVSHAPNLDPEDFNGGGDLFKVVILPSADDLLVVMERSFSGGPVILRWNGVAGQLYHVETRSDIARDAWEFLAQVDGTDPTYAITIGPEDERFFRVVSVASGAGQ